MISIRFGSIIFTNFSIFAYLSHISFAFILSAYIEKFFIIVPATLIPLCANIAAETNLQHYIHLNFHLIKPRFYSFGAVYGFVIYAYTLQFTGIPFHVSSNLICKTLLIFCGIARLGCHYYGCCWGKELSCKEKWSIKYNDKENLVLRLAPYLENKPLYPLQLVEASLCIMSGAVLYMISITIDYDVSIHNLIAYYVIRYNLNKYRHDCTKNTNIWDFIITPLVLSTYLYLNPANVKYVGFAKQLENYIKSHSTYYGLIPAFAYGFHYRKLGYWYNPANETIDQLNKIRDMTMNKMKTNILFRLYLAYYDFVNNLYNFPNDQIHVVYYKDTIIGYLLMDKNYTNHLFIDPEFQDNKIAYTLFQYVVNYLKTNNYNNVYFKTTSYMKAFKIFKYLFKKNNMDINLYFHKTNFYFIELYHCSIPYYELEKLIVGEDIHCNITVQVLQN